MAKTYIEITLHDVENDEGEPTTREIAYVRTTDDISTAFKWYKAMWCNTTLYERDANSTYAYEVGERAALDLAFEAGRIAERDA